MRARKTSTRLALSILFTLLCVSLLAVHASATEGMKRGPPASTDEVHPVLMSRWHDFPLDLTGDGVPEHLLMGGDAVVHAYHANGSLLWASDTERIIAGKGLPVNSAGLLFGPFVYLTDPAGAGPAFTDLDGDGIVDLVAGMFIALDDPIARLQSAVVGISGANGTPLMFRLHDGIVRNVVIDDFTGDGEMDLFYTEEDGPVHTNRQETHTIGTGGTFTAHLSALNGTAIWSRALPEEWAQATTIGIGVFDGAGPDIALTVTGSFDEFKSRLDNRTTPFPQTLYALDGQTGSVAWRSSLPAEFAREMHLVDMDGDLIDDVVLRIQESSNMHSLFTRGDERARLTAFRGLDGTLLWDQVGVFGEQPKLHDSVVRDGTEPTLLVAFSAEGDAAYNSEDSEHLALVRLRTGAILTDVGLTQGIDTRGLVEGALDLGSHPTPSALSAHPDIRAMRIAEVEPTEGRYIVGSDRGLVGVAVGATGAEVSWRNEGVHADREVLYALGSELWTQDVSGGKMLVYRTHDGELLRDVPLMTLVSAETRIDLDQDGDLDRVAATSGFQVVAFRDDSTVPVWRQDVEDAVIDLVAEDVDRDSVTDVVVIGRLTIFALDGTSGSVLWRHDHGETGQVSAWRFEEIDGDGVKDLVFGTRTANQGGGSSLGGTAFVTRLDGATGQTVWTRVFSPPAWEIGGIDLGDVDGDGTKDVAFVTQTSTQAVWYHAGVLDGALGLPLWEVKTPVVSGNNTMDADGVLLVDVDADGDLDVLVGRTGLQTRITQNPPSLQAHEGRTGLTLWTKPLDPDGSRRLHGLYTGALGPNGTQAIAATTDLYETGWGVRVLTLSGEELYRADLTPIAFFTDLKIGDVTGDRFDDLVLASPHGLTALDGNASINGNVTFVGHLTNWAASKVHLVDLDDDVALEVDFFSSEANWPLHIGPLPYTDLARAKALGTADFDLGPKSPIDDGDGGSGDGGSGPSEPVNQAPKASLTVSTAMIHPGDPVTFTSTSTDADGNITSTAWTFSDGVTAAGTSVTRSFSTGGGYWVALTVTDDAGATATTTLWFGVIPPENWHVNPSRTQTWASPGETVTYRLSILNGGSETTTFDLTATATEGWSASVMPTTISVPPGTSRSVEVTAVIEEAVPQGEVSVRVVSGSGRIFESAHPVLVPLVLDAALDESDGEYHPAEEVTGTLRLHWRDGTPVSGVSVVVQVDGRGSGVEVVTDENGRARFTAPQDGLWQVGSHWLRLDPHHDPFGTYRALPFQVSLTG